MQYDSADDKANIQPGLYLCVSCISHLCLSCALYVVWEVCVQTTLTDWVLLSSFCSNFANPSAVGR